MKTYFFNGKILTLLLITMLVVISGCGEDDVEPTGNFVKCSIDGESFTSSITSASYGYNLFAITGMSNNGEKFANVTILNPVEGKTYKIEDIVSDMDNTNVTVAMELDQNYTARVGMGSGTITLTHFDGEKASGTFSVEAVDFNDPIQSVSVTNGEFSINSIVDTEVILD